MLERCIADANVGFMMSDPPRRHAPRSAPRGGLGTRTISICLAALQSRRGQAAGDRRLLLRLVSRCRVLRNHAPSGFELVMVGRRAFRENHNDRPTEIVDCARARFIPSRRAPDDVGCVGLLAEFEGRQPELMRSAVARVLAARRAPIAMWRLINSAAGLVVAARRVFLRRGHCYGAVALRKRAAAATLETRQRLERHERNRR